MATIFLCAADILKGSLALAREPAKTGTEVIHPCQRQSLAKAAKLLNLEKCSSSRTLKGPAVRSPHRSRRRVRLPRERYPGVLGVT